MNRLRMVSASALILLSAFAIYGESKEEKQDKARKKADETLVRL